MTGQVTLNGRARVHRLGWGVARWLLTGGGGLPGMSPARAGAFLRSRRVLKDPDLRFAFTPASYSAEGVTGALQRTPGMTIGVWQMRPESRGHVRARSPDPAAPPAIQPDHLAAPEDRAAAVAGLRRARRLLAT